MHAYLAVGVTAAILVTGSGPATARSASPAQVSVQTAGTARAAAPVKGALRLRITGLPTGVRPQVRITGPGRYRKTVKRTGTLKKLTPGVYKVATPRVSIPAGKATGMPSKRRVKVKGRADRQGHRQIRVDRHRPTHRGHRRTPHRRTPHRRTPHRRARSPP